ncbi:MAG: ABC-2 transporter permease [Tissierellia bacterium]|nr:ABC-2 transporter permease [Tissierellia bacterium]
MNAYIKKDLNMILRGGILKFAALFALIPIIALAFKDSLAIISFLPVMNLIMIIMMIVSTIGTDLQVGFEKFAFSSPLTRYDYIFSKYLMAWVISLILATICAIIVVALKILPFSEIFFFVAALFSMPNIILAIMIPLFYKFGINKARFIIFGVYILIMGFGGVFMSLFKDFDIFRFLIDLGQIKTSLLFIAFTMVLSLISLMISKKILEKNEY